jgi:peptide deformylase
LKILPVKIYGEDVLRQTAGDVENIDGKLIDFADSLIRTLKYSNALGLAANQVGLAKRIYAVDMSYFDVVKPPIVIINPWCGIIGFGESGRGVFIIPRFVFRD